MLEQDGATRSMQSGGVAWESRLNAAHYKLKHIEAHLSKGAPIDENVRLWSDAELEFHQTLISGCGSPVLIDTYSGIYLRFRQQLVSQRPDYTQALVQRIIVEHQTILDAALARNVDACRAAIHDHLSRHLHG
jgi:DNA-binding GntR family transcriptional regulator